MDVPLKDLHNCSARVIDAIESGELLVLTSEGRPVADIIPRPVRSESRSTEALLCDLDEISALASELGVKSNPADFDLGYTTDDFTR